MAFLTRIKRWLNITTPGANAADYEMNEVNVNKMVDDIERMITVYNDVFFDVLVSGGREQSRVLLTNNITKCLVYAKGNRVQQLADTTGHTYSASKDIYVYLNTTTSLYVFYEVALGASAPTPLTDEWPIAKIVTNATQITSYTLLANRFMGSAQGLQLKHPNATYSTRQVVDNRSGLFEGLVWNAMNVYLDEFGVWQFDDDTKMAMLSLLHPTSGSDGKGSIEWHTAPPNPGGTPSFFRVLHFGTTTVDASYGASKLAVTGTANTFDQNQTIKKATPLLVLDADSGTMAVAFRRLGVRSIELASNAIDDFSIRDSTGTTQFTFNASSKKMTKGTVPHGRTLFRLSSEGFNIPNSGQVQVLMPGVNSGDIIEAHFYVINSVLSGSDIWITFGTWGGIALSTSVGQGTHRTYNSSGVSTNLYLAGSLSGVAAQSGTLDIRVTNTTTISLDIQLSVTRSYS